MSTDYIKIVKYLQTREFELFLQEIKLLNPNDPTNFLLRGMGIINIKDDSLYFKMYVKEENQLFENRSFISDLSKNKNIDVWSLQNEPGKARFKWKQIKNNIGYSDPSYFTVRHVLETIPMARSLTKHYRDLDRE